MDFARAKIESGTRTNLTLRDACSSWVNIASGV